VTTVRLSLIVGFSRAEMRASLDVTLRQFIALQGFEHTTRAISKFLGPPPNLLLSEACERGSVATLEWIWTASCTTVKARTPGWSLTNYLRADPHYYRWQFAKSLYAAAERGDLEIVEWLFAHFSGCEAPLEVVRIAERRGNVRVLRFLWAHRSREQKEAAQTERLPRSSAGIASDCTVQFGFMRYNYDAEYWGEMAITKAVGNGQLARYLDDRLEPFWYDRLTAITEALRLGAFELAERLIPSGISILQYATDCPRPEVIAQSLGEGFLQWDEERAATAFSNLAESGSCGLMQQILQLHSPLRQDHSCWRSTWREAFKAACSGGNLCVLTWLMEHSLGSEVCDELKKKTPDRTFSPSVRHDAATEMFHDAATKGHVEVMQCLYEKGVASIGSVTKREAIRTAIEKGQLESVKWFVDHGVVQDQRTFTWAIYHAAEFGRLAILQLLQTLAKPGGYEAAGLKRRRTGENFLLWGGQRYTFYWAASGGHVAVLEWLQANYPAECGVDAMDAAASGGHLDALKWLHANRTEGCTSDALYQAAEEGHFEVVKWLYESRPESRTCTAIVSAFRRGHFRIAYWLHFKFPDFKLSQDSVDVDKRLLCCCFHGKPLEALLFLRAIYPSVFTERFVKQTREDCTEKRGEDGLPVTLVQRWLDDNYPSTGELGLEAEDLRTE
jgi:hypothetical protein